MGDSLTEGTIGSSFFDILQKKLLQHELTNWGKGGDTVKSLYRRLLQSDGFPSQDLGFLWIGVNDVFVKTSWTFPLIKRLRNQPWSRNRQEFREDYKRILELLHQKMTHIYTVPPLLIGEDLGNPWNRELNMLSHIIQDVSSSFAEAEFIDLRKTIAPLLTANTSGPYVPKSFSRMILDALFVKTPEEMEKKAAERGLILTLDGVHLNSAGAGLVAGFFLSKIEEFCRRPPSS